MELNDYLVATVKGEITNQANSQEEIIANIAYAMKLNIQVIAANYAKYYYEQVKGTEPSPLSANDLFFEWLENEYLANLGKYGH
jgi:hypothetical protein